MSSERIKNTGGPLLEFPRRTAMPGKSCVSSAMSVCDNQQNFETGFSTLAVDQIVFYYF